MGYSQERLSGSQTVALVHSLSELVSRLPPASTDSEADMQFRLRAGIDATRAVVLGADPNLATPRMIEGPAALLSQLHNAVSAYVGAGDAAQLISATEFLDNVIDALAMWLQRPAREARQTVAALHRDAAVVVEDLRRRAAEVAENTSATAARIDEVRREIDTLVAEAETAAASSM